MDLSDIIKALEKRIADTPKHSENPADYPIAIEITDPELKRSVTVMSGLSAEMQSIMTQINELTDRYTDLLQAREAHKTLFFRHAKQLYPQIAKYGNTGWRDWEGKVYFTGWEGNAPEAKDK